MKKAGAHVASGKDLEHKDYHRRVDELANTVEQKVIDWRHDIHQHPELSNREFRTSKLVAEVLKSLQLDTVKTNIAPTGVVGIKAARPVSRSKACIRDSRSGSR